MEQYVVLAQKNVLFHGIWKAQYKVSDSLIKSIGTAILSTPSRACKLVLTSAGLTLILVPSADGKRGKTDQISFDSLRDIVPNQYYPKCLMIIYVDETNKFSVMACSSEDQKDIDCVSKAYKDRRNLLQHQRTRSEPQASFKPTVIEKQRYFSDGNQSNARETKVKTSISNGIMQGTMINGAMLHGENFGSSQRSNSSHRSRHSSSGENADMEDVFFDSRPVVVHEPEVLIREPVNHNGQPEAFHTGMQTVLSEEEFDTESITSSNSVQALRDDVHALTEDMKAIKFLLEKSTGISAEEYYKRNNIQGNRRTVGFHLLPRSQPGDTDQAGDLLEHVNGRTDLHLISSKDGDNEDYDIRSIGMQTLQSNRPMRRYAKKPVNVSTSNAYKEKIAVLRTRSSSAGARNSNSSGSGSVVNSETPSSTLGSSVRSNTSSTVSQQRSTTSSSSGASRPVNRNMSSGSTVIKPIESVYQVRVARKSHGGKGQRMIVYPPDGQNHK